MSTGHDVFSNSTFINCQTLSYTMIDTWSISCGNLGKPNKSIREVVIWVESKQKQKIFEIMKSKQYFKPPAVVFVSSRVGDLLSEAITAATGLE
ncbi:unnamed protein product [Triticum turgidum subsp. durum]|uniref:Uncharacterized protein n=1 Tax=Triticum turgidum subsp. durum TaxID=4567 RepID=A0A9R0WKG6_TRITD|nr:unnamed protein product [Triticum turgidum subsp. durum]